MQVQLFWELKIDESHRPRNESQTLIAYGRPCCEVIAASKMGTRSLSNRKEAQEVTLDLPRTVHVHVFKSIAVYADLPSSDTGGNTLRLVDVVSVNATSQAVFRLVCKSNSF